MSHGPPSRQPRLAAVRIVAGFALVPPGAAMIAVPLYAVLFAAGLLPRGAPIDSLDSVLGFGSGVLILALVVTVLCAIPAVDWLAGRGPLSLRRLMALGALLGNIPFITIVVVVAAVQLARGTLTADVGQYWEGSAGALVRVAMGSIVGAGSALILWVVAIEGNGSWDTRAIGQDAAMRRTRDEDPGSHCCGSRGRGHRRETDGLLGDLPDHNRPAGRHEGQRS